MPPASNRIVLVNILNLKEINNLCVFMIDLSPSYVRHAEFCRQNNVRYMEARNAVLECTFWRFLGLTYHYANLQQFLNETAAYMR